MCKVADHENHVRWIYLTTILCMGEGQNYARNNCYAFCMKNVFQVEMKRVFEEGPKIRHLDNFEKLLAGNNGGDGYFVGDEVCIIRHKTFISGQAHTKSKSNYYRVIINEYMYIILKSISATYYCTYALYQKQ